MLLSMLSLACHRYLLRWGVCPALLLVFYLAVFILFSFKNYLYTLDTSLYQYLFYKYFPFICGLPFHSLNIDFHRTEDFHFNKIQLTYFFFTDHDLGVMSKNWSPNPKNPRFFFPISSSWSYMILCLHLGLSFVLIFVKGVRSVSQIFFSFSACWMSNLLKNTVLSPLTWLFFFVEDQLTVFM